MPDADPGAVPSVLHALPVAEQQQMEILQQAWEAQIENVCHQLDVCGLHAASAPGISRPALAIMLPAGGIKDLATMSS